jgi:short-subunit dehydrogenase
VVNTVATFLPLLRRRSGQRHILLTASSSVLAPGVRLGAYVASKFAVAGYGETLRMELAHEGIGVSILFPAGMDTRHLESSALARPPELGPSLVMPDDIDAMLSSMETQSTTATPEYATRNLLASLAANERYIITHGQYRDQLSDRYDGYLRALDRAQEHVG